MQLCETLVAAGLMFVSAGSAAPASSWRVGNVSLRIDSEQESTLTASVSDASTGVPVKIEGKVRLTRVEQSFVVEDKLVVTGEAGRTWEVAIFDLAKRQEIDRFACALPQRISANWIAYVEWYPDHITYAEPREVVLIYDLTKSPVENRLPGVRFTPPSIPDTPTAVGLPVYPEWNVRNRSYRNMVENPSEGEAIMKTTWAAWCVLLPRDRLVFAAARGPDFPRSWNFLVVVDMSRGLNNPVIATLDIPKHDLKKPGENPRFLLMRGLEAVEGDPDAVRLIVPELEYGVDSIVVKIPD